MMFIETDKILLAILVHFLADFVAQTRRMAVNKSTHWSFLGAHCLIIFLFFWPFFGWKFALCNAIIHAIIDKNIWSGYKFIRRNEDIKTFQYWNDSLFYSFIGFDQLLHITTLIFLLDMRI